MKRLKYFPTQDYSFLLDENHYVYDHVENEDSLHIYIKSREHGCCCPVLRKNRVTSFMLLTGENLLGYPYSDVNRLLYMQRNINNDC